MLCIPGLLTIVTDVTQPFPRVFSGTYFCFVSVLLCVSGLDDRTLALVRSRHCVYFACKRRGVVTCLYCGFHRWGVESYTDCGVFEVFLLTFVAVALLRCIA